MPNNSNYVWGIAFVTEGPTEETFYRLYLEYLCVGLSVDCSFGIEHDCLCYQLEGSKGKGIVFFKSVNAVTQMPHCDKWFKSVCLPLYPDLKWNVFLCYDTDDYRQPITKFQQGDWALMKRSIRQKGVEIYDFASCADIEDLFLLDCGGVCKFLGLPSATKMPSGNKGKSKIKKLFRLAGSYYHPGERAEDLIKALDMRTVVQKSSLPFQKLENIIKQIA